VKREDRATDPAPAGDFHRTTNDATSDPLVEFLTNHSGFSVEEHEKVLLRIYGPDRLPGTESRRRSNMGETASKHERACAQCGEPLMWRPRFCSQACWAEWRESHPKYVLDAATQAEMQAALDALRQEVIE
jgi:hypothetical protein